MECFRCSYHIIGSTAPSASQQTSSPWGANIGVTQRWHHAGLRVTPLRHGCAMQRRRWFSRLRLHAQLDGSKTSLIKQLEYKKTKPKQIAEVVSALRTGNCMNGPHEYTSALVAYCRHHCWREAYDILEEMHERVFSPKASAYNNLMSACSKHDQWQLALGLFVEMQQKHLDTDKFSYTSAINICEKSGQWAGALDLLDKMREDVLAPDAIHYNAAIIACEKVVRWEWALNLLENMRADCLKPDLVTQRALRRACEKGEQQVRALRMQVADYLPETSLVPDSPLPYATCSLHFCIFQAGSRGLDSWSLEAGCKNDRWDTILLGLLQCVMMDGQWLQDVAASAFVGPDVVHVSGVIQSLVMRELGRGTDGQSFYQPATVKAWEEMLWQAQSCNFSGLHWWRGPPTPQAEAARVSLLEHVDKVLESAPVNAVVLAFTVGGVQATYDELKMRGASSAMAKAERVYVLLGGAHGFDGQDDRDSSFFEAVLERFEQRLGIGSLARVSLCEGGAIDAIFPLSKVTSFVSTEHARGALWKAVAGLESLRENQT